MDELGQVPNLERRGAVYRCRMRCPKHLLREGVPAEKSLSLRTKERSVALEKLPAARVELMELFQGVAKITPAVMLGMAPGKTRLRRPDHPDLPVLTSGEAEMLATDYFAAALAALELDTADVISWDSHRRAEWRMELEDRLAAFDHPYTQAEDPTLGAEISLLRSFGRRSVYGSEPSRLLREYLRRAFRQLCAIELSRMEGDYRDRITDRFFQQRTATPAIHQPKPVAAVRLADAIAAFVTCELDEDEAVTDKTRSKKKAALALIERFFGTNYDLALLTGARCREFRDVVARLPPNLSKRFAASTTLIELADRNDAARGARMSHSAQGLYLRLLNNLLAFTKSDGLIVANPFPPELMPKGKKQAREKARNAYSDAQLKAIFSSPLYTGCVDDERRFAQRKPGNIIRHSRFWLPLIALFSGLRMNEILQLSKWHVRIAEDGLPTFLIGENMTVKTEASYRLVPVHRELIRCGLMDYVRRLAADGDLLFDDVPLGPDGYASSTFSKRYATFWKSLNVAEPGRRVSFHSFRHNFRDALRLPGVDNNLAKEVGGWSRGAEISNSYGDGARATILRPIVDAVQYDLDLSHLYTPLAVDEGGSGV